jgi:hypothetical protein
MTVPGLLRGRYEMAFGFAADTMGLSFWPLSQAGFANHRLALRWALRVLHERCNTLTTADVDIRAFEEADVHARAFVDRRHPFPPRLAQVRRPPSVTDPTTGPDV